MDSIIIASSSIDAGIGAWDLATGNELLRYKSCASPPHGLVSVGGRFLASSQLRDNHSSSGSGSVLYWSWHKPQPDVKSFPVEMIMPLVCDIGGNYIIGGGSSGYIYVWEVATGRLLNRWHAHYRAATCLVLSDDESLLISGAEDGCVRVWSFFMLFDEIGKAEAKHLYEHSFTEHTLKVTTVVVGYGGCNSLIVSASEDRTCKVWSLSRGKILRDILFPCIIDAIALDPGEHVFYAGGRNGKIYIAALNAASSPDSPYGKHIIGSLHDHSKGINCLAFCGDGTSLVSGSEDGLIRIWDTRSHNIIRILRHAKGPVNNILVVARPETILKSTASLGRKQQSLLPPPLEKYSSEEPIGTKAFIGGHTASVEQLDVTYLTEYVMNNQIKDIQQHGSA
ncbi:ROOT INITIATION DEFECTIVE 3-like protein, partial [Drosera capensis]